MLIAIAFLTHGVWGRAIGHMRPYRGSGRGIRQRVTHISLDSRARTHHLDPASLGRPDEARPAPAHCHRVSGSALRRHTAMKSRFCDCRWVIAEREGAGWCAAAMLPGRLGKGTDYSTEYAGTLR